MSESNQQPKGYRNDEGLDVTKYIEKGKTKAFTDRNEAENYARSKRSYIYELYSFIVEDRREIVSFYGWAVPS